MSFLLFKKFFNETSFIIYIQAVDWKFLSEILKKWLSDLPYNQRSPSRDTF